MNYILSVIILLTGLYTFPVLNISGEKEELTYNLNNQSSVAIIDIDLEDDNPSLPIYESPALLQFYDVKQIEILTSYSPLFFSNFNSRAPPQFLN